jgi:hypothetical protein
MSDLCCPGVDVKLYTDSYRLGSTMMSMLPSLHKFTNMLTGCNKFKLKDIYTFMFVFKHLWLRNWLSKYMVYKAHSSFHNLAIWRRMPISRAFFTYHLQDTMSNVAARQNVAFVWKGLLLWSANGPPIERSLPSETAFAYPTESLCRFPFQPPLSVTQNPH